MSSSLPKSVRIVEVGPRDGLQNEKTLVPTETKVALIERLADSGLSYIESSSFVSPKWVPQMGDASEVFRTIKRKDSVTYAALTPNLKGLSGAIDAKASEVAVFAAATEAFSQKNINCSIQASLDRFKPVIEAAQAENIPVRGYVSCVLGCPYEGEVAPAAVAELAEEMLAMGCYEISLGDTIGVGTAGKARELFETAAKRIPIEKLAAHFHDTYGQAIANLFAVLELGVAVIDSSVAGLGGCPYAKGASGNVATEDVIYMLHGLGIKTGVDLDQLIDTGLWITEQLGRTSGSKVALARAKC